MPSRSNFGAVALIPAINVRRNWVLSNARRVKDSCQSGNAKNGPNASTRVGYAPPMPTQHVVRWKVRQYELDSFGHVNNAVYLNYIEQAAAEHTEAVGVGRAWAEQHGGTWVVRSHQITYHQPAVYGDEVEITTIAESFRGATGVRRTRIVRASDRVLLTDAVTEWVWLRMPDARPARIPADVIAKLAG